jgi:transposase
MPHCNTETFQIFLNEFSQKIPDEFAIILLDNGSFHKGHTLIIPENIALLFIPPYSPELNPAEKIWWKMKRSFSGKLHKTLDEVSEFIKNQVKILQEDLIRKTCGFEYVFSFPNWTISY